MRLVSRYGLHCTLDYVLFCWGGGVGLSVSGRVVEERIRLGTCSPHAPPPMLIRCRCLGVLPFGHCLAGTTAVCPPPYPQRLPTRNPSGNRSPDASQAHPGATATQVLPAGGCHPCRPQATRAQLQNVQCGWEVRRSDEVSASRVCSAMVP